MRRLQKIFAALTELAAEPLPSKAIAEAWTLIVTQPNICQDANHDMRRAVALIGKIITAVVGIAEDNEKPKATKGDA